MKQSDIHNIHLDQVRRLGDLTVPHIGAVDEEESVISLNNIILQQSRKQ